MPTVIITTDFSKDRGDPTIFLGRQGPEIITSPMFKDVGIAYIYQKTQRNTLEGLNLYGVGCLATGYRLIVLRSVK